jgi:hypothetical protein
MNIFMQYMREKQRRVSQLPTLRWWIGECLGKSFFGIGLGLWMGISWKNNFLFEIAIGVMVLGGLLMLASASRKAILLHINKENE